MPDAVRVFSSLCAEGTLHMAKPCFILHAPQARFIEKVHLALQDGLFLVETIGIEPMTPCMSSMYSNQLSYASVQRRLLYHIRRENARPFFTFFKFFDFYCLNNVLSGGKAPKTGARQ